MTQAMQTIPAGYKQTEIGVIPEDWEVKKLEEIGEIVTGNTPSTKIKEYWEGNIPWITPTDINERKNIYNSEREITPLAFQVSRKLPINTLLVTCIASIGKNTILKKHGACNQQINAIIPNYDHDVDFLYYLVENNKSYLLKKAGITATLIISKKEFSEIEFRVPKNKNEQTAIATILSDMDAEIEKLGKLVAKKKAVKLGAMQQLLTGKKRLPGFSGEWEVKKLGEIFRVTRGQVLSTRKMKDSRTPDYRYPVYSSQTLNNGLTGYFNNFLFENAITWTTDGANAGDVKYRNGKFYCTNVCGVLLSDQGYANWCIAEIFGMISKKYVSYVGNPKLMNNVVKNIPVLIPLDVKEQTAIATVLSDMDAEIKKLENKLNKYRQIKTGMMQQLLTGKIRLLKLSNGVKI